MSAPDRRLPRALAVVLPIPAGARARRFVQLFAGLMLFGFSTALLVDAHLGLDSWDVLHQGLARHAGWAIGTTTIVVSGAVLLLWIFLRQRPGFGTLSNAVVVGVAVNVSLAVLPVPTGLPLRALALVAAVGLNGVATGLYIGAGLGPGPRDGLMTGIAARGHSIRVTRTLIELAVLTAGWLLGGTVGVGTVLYALSIGPLAHVLIPAFTIDPATPVHPPRAP